MPWVDMNDPDETLVGGPPPMMSPPFDPDDTGTTLEQGGAGRGGVFQYVHRPPVRPRPRRGPMRQHPCTRCGCNLADPYNTYADGACRWCKP